MNIRSDMHIGKWRDGSFGPVGPPCPLWVCLLTALLVNCSLWGSSGARIRSIGVQDGLSHPTVYRVVQDKTGFLWLATQNGLNRYDGINIQHFLHHPGDKNSISQNSISTMILTDDNMLWLGTWGGGLDRLDPITESIVHYRHDPKDPRSLSSDAVQSLYQDSEGMIWVGTVAGGLCRLNPRSGLFTRYQHNPEDPNSLGNNRIWDIAEDGQGQLWVATDHGLNLKTETGFEKIRASFTPDLELPHNRIRTILADRRGMLWVGTERGLRLLDPVTRTFLPYLENQENATVHGAIITVISQDRSDRIWIGTLSDGMFEFILPGDGSVKGSFRQYNFSPMEPDGLTQNDIRAIYEDRSGILWIGTRTGGLNMLDLKPQKFKHYLMKSGHSRDLVFNRTNAILEDKTGNLWVGAYGGLIRWDRLRDQHIIYTHEANDPTSLSDNRVFALHQEEPGALWVGTFSGGLNHLDMATGRFQRFLHDPENPDSLVDNNVVALLSDHQQRLWVGTYRGLDYLEPGSETVFTHYQGEANEPLAGARINTLMEDSEQRLWIGTDSQGLFRSVDGKLVHFHPSSSKISSERIWSLHQDRDGILWIGTRRGLNRLDDPSVSPDSATFHVYTVEQGLPNDVIYAILSDLIGYLWLSTDQGISRLDRENGTFHNYDVYDGLQGNGFNPGASYHSLIGEFFFGGNHGFNAFFPDQVKNNPLSPRVVITSLKKLNKEARFERHISAMDEISLTHRDNVVSLEFAALDFTVPAKNRFAWQLEGFDRDWIYAGTKHDATYTNLPAGRYTFRVKGTNSDGIWNYQGTSLVIEVIPPPWKTWWAYVFYLFVLALLIHQFIRSQQQKLMHIGWVNERLRHVDKLKDEFLTNTSHELRTPLNGIIGIVESLIDGIAGPLPKKAVNNLDMVLSSGRRLAGMVDNILDFSKLKARHLVLETRPVDLRSVVDVVLTIVQPLVGSKQLKLLNHVDANLPAIESDENRLHQILLNLVDNAIKFSEQGTVTVSAQAHIQHVEIKIQDTGIGIPPEKHDLIFESFQQADGSTVREYEGTGLGLSITRQLIELHGGCIRVDSEPGKGSCFTFTLPISSGRKPPKKPARAPVVARSRVEVEQEILQASGQAEVVVGETDKGSRSYTPGNFHVLVVDDERVNRRVLSNHLTLQNYRVTEAVSGEDALVIIHGEADIDLILLDIMMPRMSGYEVCRELRKTHSVQDLPIIFLTAKDKVGDLVTGFEIGANDYLYKPVAKGELLARISTHLQLLDTHRTLEHKVASRTRELEEKNEELTGLEGIIKAINQQIELPQVLETMLDRCVHLVDRAEKGIFLLWNPEKGHFRFAAALGLSQEEQQRNELHFENLLNRVIPMGESVEPGVMIVSSLNKHLSDDEDHDGMLLPLSMMVIEISLVGRLAGFLVLFNMDDAHAFTHADASKVRSLPGTCRCSHCQGTGPR